MKFKVDFCGIQRLVPYVIDSWKLTIIYELVLTRLKWKSKSIWGFFNDSLSRAPVFKNTKKVLAMKEVIFAQQYLELHSKVSIS